MKTIARWSRTKCLVFVSTCFYATFQGCARWRPHEETATVPTAWEKTTNSLFNDAFADFCSLSVAEGEPATRNVEILFGRALSLFNVQPKTSRNLKEAQDILEEIILTHADSPFSPAARYYLARIAELHQREPDLEKAKRIYRELMTSHPGSFFAQIAVIKFATLTLFEVTSPERKHLLYAELEPLAYNLTDPHLNSVYHFLLTDCAFRFGLPPEKALFHAQAAEGGLAWSRTRVDIYFWAGQAAIDLGRYDLAEDYFSRYLKASPRSIRSHYVRQLRDRVRSEQQRSLLTPLSEWSPLNRTGGSHLGPTDG